MAAEVLLYFSLGVGAGILTGLIPGVHNNTLALIVLGAYLGGMVSADPLLLGVFVLAMGVSNSFLEFVPSVFLGAPDPDVSLAVSPGHRFLLSGRGIEAVMLATLGGVLGIVLLLSSTQLLFLAIPRIYDSIRPNIHLLLLALMTVMIAIEKKKAAALAVFLLSGAFGVAALSLPVNRSYVLLPVLVGLFGLSSRLFRSSAAPKVEQRQRVGHRDIKILQTLRGSVLGFFGGILAGILPGFGSAQAAVLLQYLSKLRDERTFLVAHGAINSTNILLSVLALILIGNPRSGTAVVIQNMLPELSKYLGVFLWAGFTAALLGGVAAYLAGIWFARISRSPRFEYLEWAVVAFLLGVIFLFSGPLGLAIAAVGTAIGGLPHIFGVKKSLCMGCLIVPTILFFFGYA